MRDNYVQQLRTDSIFLVIPIAVVTAIVMSHVAFFLQDNTDSTVDFIVLVINILLPIFFGQLAWRYAQTERIVLASYLVIGSNLLLIAFNYARVNDVSESFLPYLFGFFIVVSSTLIRPIASVWTWACSLVLILLVLFYRDTANMATVGLLIDPIILNLLLALGSFVTKIDWEMAIYEAFESNMKAQRQRDEWYEVQDELRKINARQEFLYKELSTSMAVGQRITAILDIAQLLDQVANLIQETLSFAYVGILLMNEDEAVLEIQAQHTKQYDAHIEDTPISLNNASSIGQAAATQNLVKVMDVAAADYHSHPFLLLNVRSEASLPLMMGGRLLGVINIQSYTVDAFNENTIGMLQLLADQVAVAINNALLYEQLQIRYRLTTILNKIQQAITQTIELDQVLDLILDNLATLVSYDRAAVVLLHHHTEIEYQLEMIASRGYPEVGQTFTVPVENNEHVFLQIYDNKRPLRLPDVALFPAWRNHVALPDARTWLGVPLIIDDVVIGMLSLTREIMDSYTKDDEELAITFAAQAAVALQNARLYNDLKTLSQDLELKVALRTKELREINARLTQLDKAKSDFIAVTSHELRTPLTVLKGYSDMLNKDRGIQENAYYKQLVDGIYSGSIRMHDVVNDMLDVVKLDNEEFNLYHEPTVISEVVDLVERPLRTALQERNIQLKVNDLESIPPIEADSEALQKVFRHLLTNAIKYTPDGGTITITAEPFDLAAVQRAELPADYEGIHVIIADTGIGIDRAFQDVVFTKFYQTGKVAAHSSGKIKFKGGGPGLGLAIADGIVKAHDGALWVESERHDEETLPGSRFHLVLPLKHSPEAVTAD